MAIKRFYEDTYQKDTTDTGNQAGNEHSSRPQEILDTRENKGIGAE
jgi:hypothetical protein